MKKIFILFLTTVLCYTTQAQLTVDTSNGNVGVKDSSPEEALTISGNTSSNNFGTNYFIFSNLYSGGLSSSLDKNGFRWQAPNQSSFGADSIRFYQLYNYGEDKLFFDNDADYSNGAHLTIEREGNVGIGTTTPLNTLQVDGDALFNSSQGYLKFGFPTGNGWGYSTTGGGATLYLLSYTNTSTEAGSTNRVTFKNNGTNGFGTTSPQKTLHAVAESSGGALRLSRSGSTCNLDAGAEISEAFIGTTSNHNFRFLTNNTVRMQIQSTGNVGIGTISPAEKLDVNGAINLGTTASNNAGSIRWTGTDFEGRTASDWVSLTSGGDGSLWSQSGTALYYNSGNVGIGTAAPTYALHLMGDMGISGQIYGVSDRRLKEDIQPVESGLEKIAQMKPVTYKFKTTEFPTMHLAEGKQYGLIAQDLETILPGVVSNDAKAINKAGEEMEIKAVNYTELIPVLIAAVQELKAELEEKDVVIAEMKASIEENRDSRIEKREVRAEK